MLVECADKDFARFFPQDPHPFVSEAFLQLNAHKSDGILRLCESVKKPTIGLRAGIVDKKIMSPFSAPFGGLHFRKQSIYISEIENFIALLKTYVREKELEGIEITLPPDIYHPSFNAKLLNVLYRSEFRYLEPDITNWVDLKAFSGSFTQRNSREYLGQALRNQLVFEELRDPAGKRAAYELIRENRRKFGRPIYMEFEVVLQTAQLWGADFFQVRAPGQGMVASAIFYRYHPQVCFALFWGDNEAGRPLRAMDFLAHRLWNHYKESGFIYIDLGISTESGIPNEGLLRFKESHDASSSIRSRFGWSSRS